MGKIVYWVEKALFLGIGIGVVLFVLGSLKIWGAELNQYFMFTGDLESVIVITIIVTGATIIMEKLWKWEVHQIFKPKRGRR